MSIECLLADHGVTLHIDGKQLKVKAPRGAITPELQAVIRTHKEELILHLHRKETSERLQALYAELGRRFSRQDYLRAASIPGWREHLDNLEESYTNVWRAGGNPREEFEALANHWRLGLTPERK
jgi:hypothetical protein